MKKIGAASDVPPGTVTAMGGYAVGNHEGEYFATSRHCRHFGADLTKGSIDANGCLVCPLHGARYDVKSGRMVRGPRRGFEKVPGLEAGLRGVTKAWPLRIKKVTEKDGDLFVE